MAFDDNSETIHKVLIIDDDEINNFVFEKVIKRSNIAGAAISIQSGSDALAYLQQTGSDPSVDPPELILLDINMPFMNGWEFLAHYRDLPLSFGKPPVIAVLSSSVYEADSERAEAEPEIHDYITKPLTVENFTNLVKRHFSSSPEAY